MTDGYRLVRSDRRTLCLTVDSGGALIVRAPRRMPLAEIEGFIAQKREWIERWQSAARQPRPALRLEDGETLPCLGEALTLRFGDFPRARREGDTLLTPPSAAAIADWAREEAARLLPVRIEAMERRSGLRARSLHITAAKGRWGSMNQRGDLRLNRALLLCPPEIVDYVIAHELAHIEHPDHSAAFWARVERILPDYAARRRWLKQNAYLVRYFE